MVGSRRKRVELSGLLTAAGAIIFSATLAGFAGRFWWAFDLFSHFRVQYLISISLVILLLLPGKRFYRAALFGLCAAINLACILPYYLPGEPRTVAGTTPLRAVSINVNTANQRYDLVKQYIKDNDPDVILLMEVNAAWDRTLEEIQTEFPYHKSEPREDNFGIAFFSKRAFSKCDVVYLGQAGAPSIIAEFEIADQRLTILGTHPLPPISRIYTNMRNDQIEAIAEYLSRVPGPKMLVGDLNMSPWSYYFGRLLGETGLADSSIGRGIEPTWPTNQFLLRIPIDFCLVSDEIIVKHKSVGPNLGSDHFPLLVDILLAEPVK